MYRNQDNEKRIATVQHKDPVSSVEEAVRKYYHGNNIMNELRRLHTFYNTTLNEMKNVNYSFVGGTISGYYRSNFFKDSWDHPKE